MKKIFKLTLVFLMFISAIAQAQTAKKEPDALHIDKKGNVGIGTDKPEANLHVNGNVKVSKEVTIEGDIKVEGNINTTGKIIENGYDLVPKGMIIMWYPEKETNTPPGGWAFCDGNNGTPNLQGRFVRGVSEQANNLLGKTGGTEEVEFKLENLPEHSHDLEESYYIPSHDKISADKSPNSSLKWTVEYYENLTKSFELQTIKSKTEAYTYDGWHENRPGYYALYYIIKQ